MTQDSAASGGPPGAPPNGPQILLQKIYLKDASVEVPLAPQIYTRPWQPQVDLNVSTQVTHVMADQWQVLLGVTVTAKLGEDVAFLVEVQQAGVFSLSGFSEADRQAVLAGFCAGTVFPFAREAVCELIQRSGFPALLLQPINFEALYADHQARINAQTPIASGEVTH